jgi:hypothetical protein
MCDDILEEFEIKKKVKIKSERPRGLLLILFLILIPWKAYEFRVAITRRSGYT